MLAAGACATIPPCPAKGGPAWIELTSQHFAVRTDLSESEARETVQRLEETRAAMLALVWTGAPEPPIRTEAIVLRSIREFAAFTRDPHAPPQVWGFREGEGPLGASIVLGGTDFNSAHLLNHELAHDLVAWYMPLRPPWYDEGLANFLETISYDRRTGMAELGEPVHGRVPSSRTPERFPAPALLDDAFSENDRDIATFENRAWLLIDYLLNVRPKDFDRLSAALESLKSTTAAWSRVMTDLPIEHLDAELNSYAARGSYRVVRSPVAVAPPEIRMRVMTDAEVHVVRAKLLGSSPVPGVPPDRQGVARELAEAIRLDPTNVEATARRLLYETPVRDRPGFAPAARNIAAVHPEDWRAWLMISLTVSDPTTRRSALARGLALNPNQPLLMTQLAALDLDSGRFQEAQLLGTRAMSFRQNLWPAAFVTLRAQAALGNCPEAAALAEVIQRRGPESIRPFSQTILRGSHCAPPAPP